MKIVYENNKVEKQCTSIKAASKLFGGNRKLVRGLMSRINAIEQADVIRDIIVMPAFRFHALQGKFKGLFAIDVKTKKDKWRIVLQPLDENENTFDPCNIDEIAMLVKIIKIKEVSAHYEQLY